MNFDKAKGSKTIYAPDIVKDRFVHFSYLGESCVIRDFIGGNEYKHFKTSEIEGKIRAIFDADSIPISNHEYWVKRLSQLTSEKLGKVVHIDSKRCMDRVDEINKIGHEPTHYSYPVSGNRFTSSQPKLLFYGERGIVNSLFWGLSQKDEAFKEFVGLVRTCQGRQLYDKPISKYRIVIEPDFGKVGFGMTDAVITINDELLIMFEAKRCSFLDCSEELSYQVDLNYAIAGHLAGLGEIPSEINCKANYSSDINKSRGSKPGMFRHLQINDEHRFFFEDFVICSDFSCMVLTDDIDGKEFEKWYQGKEGFDLNHLSWIGYNDIKALAKKYNLDLLIAHLEMNRRHLGSIAN